MKWTSRLFQAGGLLLLAGLCLLPAINGQAPPDAPPVPKGVEVMARGPVHEAFATPTSEPQATKPVPKQPPPPLEEMPPDERPAGDVIWISGYWAWDEERTDFLWVSGIWRAQPPGRQWVSGYWNQTADGFQYVSGFWNPVAKERPADVTYLPTPPAPPAAAPPGQPPAADTFFVPGHWEWNGVAYAWRAGYWARVQPGYVWVPAHYRWTPTGYIYIAGYWDLAVTQRGVMYAPVYVDTRVVGATFVYTPAYAVSDTVVLNALFVRPAYGVYYFGDYYGPQYASAGYVSGVVYSRSNYDSIIVYERTRDPAWFNASITLTFDRDAGRAPLPPRTLVQQNTIIQQTVINNNNTVVNNSVVNNNTTINRTNNTNVVNNAVTNNVTKNTTQVLAPTSQVVAARGGQTVKVDQATRLQVRNQARQVAQASVQARQQTERAGGGPPKTARTASLNIPKAQPVTAHTASTNTNTAGNKLGSAASANSLKAAGNPNNTAAKQGPVNPLANKTTAAGTNLNNPAGKSSVRPGQPNGSGRQPPGVGTPPPGQRPVPPGQNQKQTKDQKDKKSTNPPY